MSEASRIADQLRRSWEGEAWHGPALKELLQGVAAEEAAAHPLADRHNIWELVLHTTQWMRFALAALSGTPMPEPTPQEDWPPVTATGEPEWQAAQTQLQSAVDRLVRAVEPLSDDKLTAIVPGRDHNFYFLLHGIVQHNLYHAGQIALLK